MEPVALIYALAFLIALLLAILVLVLFISSWKKISRQSQDGTALWLSILTALSSFGVLAIFIGSDGLSYIPIFIIIIAFSLIFVRKNNSAVLLISFAELVLVVFSLPYQSVMQVKYFEMFRAVSALSFSAYEIAYLGGALLIVIIAILGASRRIIFNKKTIVAMMLGLLMVVGVGSAYDLYNYKSHLAGKDKYNFSNAVPLELIPFSRDNELWLVNNGRSEERKIASASGTLLYAVVSPDQNYVAYVTSTGEYPGQTHAIKSAYLVNLASGESKVLQLPGDSDLRGLDFSESNLLLLATTISTPNPSGDYYSEPKRVSANYIFGTNGKIIEQFEGFYYGNKWIGNDLYLINRTGMGFDDTTIIKKSVNSEPVLIANSPISMMYGSDKVTYDKTGKTILFFSDNEKVASILDIETLQSKRIDINHAKNEYTINLSPDGKYFMNGSSKTMDINFLQSTTNKNYILMVDGDRNGTWLDSSEQMLLESDSGLQILEIDGLIYNLTSNPKDQIFYLSF